MSLGVSTGETGEKKIGRPSPLRGQKLPPETCAKMSAARLGKKRPTATRKRIGLGVKRAAARKRAAKAAAAKADA
jgi:hypothetical protein